MTYLYIHPAWQIAATLAGFYALWLGSARARSLHLGQKVRFRRDRHVAFGLACLVGLVTGVAGGLLAARYAFGAWLVTDDHGTLGLVCAALALWGLGTGFVLKNRPAPRKLLPALHGLGNAVLLILCLVQFYSGHEVIEEFIHMY